MRNIEDPLTVPNPSPGQEERTTTTHPAFAQISASRVTGLMNLYGSDFSHHNYITISICRSQLDRDLSNDWYHDREELIEVALSEAQWATFVSAMNVGRGVPCTLNHVNQQSVPSLPAPASRADQFVDEMKETLKSSTDRLRKLQAEVKAMALPKGKTAQVLSGIAKAIQEIEANVPFVAECFDEHVEHGIEAAKVEIHGYMTGALMRSGMESIGREDLPLVLTAPTAD